MAGIPCFLGCRFCPKVCAVLRSFAVLVGLTCAPVPATAVVILDSTWEANGGAEGAEAQGFGVHEALAMQPQFAAIFGLWDGSDYLGSGTWIGNDDAGHGYILTAAHNFDGGTKVGDWEYHSRAGTAYQGLKVHIHPGYDESMQDQETSGYDMAIVVLDSPVTDAGDPPMLYGGRDELGRTLVITGFGSRGIGSSGEQDAYYNYDALGPAAATNVIDEVDGDMENNLIVDFDSEAGDASVTGKAKPVDRMEGILGSGDSGGAAWIKTADGWAIAGTNTWGDESVYGAVSGFSRVSTQLDWIASIYPDFYTVE